jgi:hypothetical protein
MPSWKALVRKPRGLIKMGEETQALKEEKLVLNRECFIGVNIQN